ncbi:MAG: hypothetical protein R2809_05335 [Flavobacteriales bacterium]
MNKVLLSILFLFGIIGISYSQTGGTTCATAAQIFCGANFSGSTSGTGGDGVSACGTEGSAGQRWFYFVAPGNGSVTLSLCSGTSYDSRIHVYTGSCGAFSCTGQNDDSCGLQSQLTWTVTSGVTYYIRIGGFSGASGTFGAVFTCSIPVGGCMQFNACNFNPDANFDNGTCDFSCYGCTYAAASNYNPSATIDNGSCIFNVVADGCTDPDACNYCNLCASDDGSCDYSCLGCMYANASNYSATATRDNGTCQFPGCTDSAALNYSPAAINDDGSCQYQFPCQGDINNDGIIGVADLITFMSFFGTTCPN